MRKKALMVALDYREECDECVNEAVDRNKEGIILKQPLSVYKPNSAVPAWLILVGEKEKPDVYIERDKSFIVKVSAPQLLHSDGFATECTLRFLRLNECRTDKHWSALLER